jgi:outer membrane lipoprotein-sorting protein
MQQSEARHRIPTESDTVKMVLQPKGGEQRTRSFKLYWAQDDAGGDKVMVRFLSPADIKGTALLTVEDKATGDDQQWMYLPAFKKTRQVGTTELGDRFVNSDVFFEDLKHRYAKDYQHKLLGSEKQEGQDCWVIESTPVTPKVKQESPYGKIAWWLRKDSLAIAKMQSFDRNMKPWKEAVYADLKPVAGEAWRAARMTVVDVRRQHRTVLIYEDREFNKQLPANTFSKHTLSAE